LFQLGEEKHNAKEIYKICFSDHGCGSCRFVTPTMAPEVTLPITSKKVNLYYCAPEAENVTLYYYNVSKGINTPVAWPGVEMNKRDNDWFEYTIQGAKSATVQFVCDGVITEDTTVIHGEHWYFEGEMLDENLLDQPQPLPTKVAEATSTKAAEATPTKGAEATPTKAAESTSKGNMRIYVRNADFSGALGADGPYLK